MSINPTNNQNPYGSNNQLPPQKQTAAAPSSNQFLLNHFLTEKGLNTLSVKLSNSFAPNTTTSPNISQAPSRTNGSITSRQPSSQPPMLPHLRSVPFPQTINLSTVPTIPNSSQPSPSRFKIESIKDLVLLFDFLKIQIHNLDLEPSLKNSFDNLSKYLASGIELHSNPKKTDISLKFKDDPSHKEAIQVIKIQMMKKYLGKQGSNSHRNRGLFLTGPFSAENLQIALSTFSEDEQKYLLDLGKENYDRLEIKWKDPINSNFICKTVRQILNAALKEIIDHRKLSEIIPDEDLRTAIESIFCIMEFKHSDKDFAFKSFRTIKYFLPMGYKIIPEASNWIAKLDRIVLAGLDTIKPAALADLFEYLKECLSCYSNQLTESQSKSAEQEISWAPTPYRAPENSFRAPEEREVSLPNKRQRIQDPQPVIENFEVEASETTISDPPDDHDQSVQQNNPENLIKIKKEIEKEASWLQEFLD